MNEGNKQEAGGSPLRQVGDGADHATASFSQSRLKHALWQVASHTEQGASVSVKRCVILLDDSGCEVQILLPQ